MFNPHKDALAVPPGYYMLDSRYARPAYFPSAEYAENRPYTNIAGFYGYPSGASPAAYMAWPPHHGEHGVPLFVPNPEYHAQVQQQMETANHRPESIASSDSSGSKKSSKSGNNSKRNQQNQKYQIPIKQNQNIQLAEIEEMAQQAERMTINNNKNNKNRERRNSGESGGSSNDSGGFYNEMADDSNKSYEIPSEDLIAKIIDQVEFYLSDEYLAKDKYLLRQIRCKSEGYISIKLMTSFKKVKKLTRDWRVVRHALLETDGLVVSPEGFRVKRHCTLPDTLRKPRLLTSVVAIRVPPDFDSVDCITSLFRTYGEIGLVRLLRPGKEVPSDLRNYATQVPDIGNSLCAVVDFESSEAALKAVRELKERFTNTGMRLALLGPRMRRTLYRQDRLAAQGKLEGSTSSSKSDTETCSSADTSEIISSRDSGHGHSDNQSEISDHSDGHSGKASPNLKDQNEKKKSKSQNQSTNKNTLREPTGPGEQTQGFRIARQISNQATQ